MVALLLDFYAIGISEVMGGGLRSARWLGRYRPAFLSMRLRAFAGEFLRKRGFPQRRKERIYSIVLPRS